MAVPNLDFVILFVASPAASSQFYSQILGLAPVEQSPTFVLFALPNGVKLGLWSRDNAQPKVTAPTGCSEIAFTDAAVDEIYERWRGQGVSIAQDPLDNEAGRNFVALDPDGHRIRVFWMGGQL